MQIPYSYIAIEGNIGAGKTTLANLLKKKTGARLLEETFEENPFLPLFYADPERYALQVELSFLAARYHQMKHTLIPLDAFNTLTIADYSLVKSRLFARQNLTDDDFKLYLSIYEIVENTLPKPELILYLHETTPQLLKNIAQRGRSYETEIKADYLNKLERSYIDYIKKETAMPVLLFTVTNIDFLTNPENVSLIIDAISKPQPKGLQIID